MKKLDETEIIKKFQSVFGTKNFISEDVESFPFGKETAIAKVDTLVQSTDIPPKMSLKQAARKSVVACVSDFASKGIKPRWGIVSVVLPKNTTNLQLNQIAAGFKEASKEFGIKFLGGDTNQGKEIVFNVSLFGESKKFVKRKGAKSGDIIFVTGPFGLTGAGLSILLGKLRAQDIFAKKATKSVLQPKPRLEFGVKCKKLLTSAMDSSDGLSTTLAEMSRQSKSKFVIDHTPATNQVEQFCQKYKKDYDSVVFHTGEEYEFVFTIAKKHISQIVKIANSTKTPIIQIGTVEKGKGVFTQKNDKLVKLEDKGYRHF